MARQRALADGEAVAGRGGMRQPVVARAAASGAAPQRLPKAPVFGWQSFAGTAAAPLPQVGDLPHVIFTSSGRASLYLALRQLDLPPGSEVLVASYHCPTMVAPIVRAGLVPSFFPVGGDGLPMLDAMAPERVGRARAMIVAHYFGLPKDLGGVSDWCARHGIVLIEDCAHSLFGYAGTRPVGAWGRFATASVSKFLPVPELGLLGSAGQPLRPCRLHAPSPRAQLKGAVDVLEHAARFARPAGIGTALRPLFAVKNRRNGDDAAVARRPEDEAPAAAAVMADEPQSMLACDMARIEEAPLALSRWLYRALPFERIVRRRQSNYDLFSRRLQGLAGARPLLPERAAGDVPYVFPLWVDDGDRVYHALREHGMPVYRWDRLWPGTPQAPHDHGPRWSRHVLQLLCHQDLSAADVEAVVATLRSLLPPHGAVR